MDRVTTQDILAELEIKVRTLRHWQELELIPPPTVGPHPGGRGRQATWPIWVLDRCLEIRKLTSEQKTLQEVADLLGPPKPPKRKYSFQKAAENRDRELSLQLFRVRENVGKGLRRFARNTLEIADADLVTRKQFDQLMAIEEEGRTPMLVVTLNNTSVMPADQIGRHCLETFEIVAIVPLARMSADNT